MTRIASLLVLLAALMLPSIAVQAPAQQKTLVVTGYGGRWSEVMKKTLIEPFEKQHGVKIELVTGITTEWVAKLMAGGPDNPPFDVVMGNEPPFPIPRERGFFEPRNLALAPNIKNVYDKAGAVLPLPTRILIAFSNALRDYLLFMILGLAIVILVVYSIYQSPGGRRFFDQMKLRLPLFGSLIRKGILARTCRTLSVLLNAGIPLIEAMETVAKVSGNAIIEDALTKATQRMRDGGTIADTLRETGEFPGMVTQLVATGEESGTLPIMLGRAATYYEQQVDQAVSTLSSLIEPLMIIFMGGIAGGVIFALYLPIFNLGQAMKGGVK